MLGQGLVQWDAKQLEVAMVKLSYRSEGACSLTERDLSATQGKETAQCCFIVRQLCSRLVVGGSLVAEEDPGENRNGRERCHKGGEIAGDKLSRAQVHDSDRD